MIYCYLLTKGLIKMLTTGSGEYGFSLTRIFPYIGKYGLGKTRILACFTP